MAIRMVKNLRKLRAAQGVSQQRLAEAIGTSQQSINKYENHNIEPDIAGLTSLADYFGTTVDYLIGHTACGADSPLEELELSREEFALVQDYRRLSPEEKKSIRLVVQNYLRN